MPLSEVRLDKDSRTNLVLQDQHGHILLDAVLQVKDALLFEDPEFGETGSVCPSGLSKYESIIEMLKDHAATSSAGDSGQGSIIQGQTSVP